MNASEITVEQAREVLAAKVAKGYQEAIPNVLAHIERVRDRVADATTAVGDLYRAVRDADQAFEETAAHGDWPFGEGLWGEIEPDFGVHVVLAEFAWSELVTGEGIVALRGTPLESYLTAVASAADKARA